MVSSSVCWNDSELLQFSSSCFHFAEVYVQHPLNMGSSEPFCLSEVGWARVYLDI